MTTERETDKQIAERVLFDVYHVLPDDVRDIANRLLAADAKLNEPVEEIKRYNPGVESITYEFNGMEENRFGEFVKYSDYFQAMRAMVPEPASKSQHKRLLAQLIPDGYVLVPVEPTKEMIWAFDNGPTSTHQRFRERYRNMIAAAPTPGGMKDE